MSQVCQEFRSSHTKKIVRILSVRDDNGKQVIFWSDIEREFRGAESIRQEGTSVVFLKNAANEPYVIKVYLVIILLSTALIAHQKQVLSYLNRLGSFQKESSHIQVLCWTSSLGAMVRKILTGNVLFP